MTSDKLDANVHLAAISKERIVPTVERCLKVALGDLSWSEDDLDQRANNPDWLCREAQAYVGLAQCEREPHDVSRRLQSAVRCVVRVLDPEIRVALSSYLRSLLPTPMQAQFDEAWEIVFSIHSGSTEVIPAVTVERLQSLLPAVPLSLRERELLQAEYEASDEPKGMIAARLGLTAAEYDAELRRIHELIVATIRTNEPKSH